MSKLRCKENGFHSYADWREVKGNRVNYGVYGSKTEQYNYYVRNCEFCDAVQVAYNTYEKTTKTAENKKVKRLVVKRNQRSL